MDHALEWHLEGDRLVVNAKDGKPIGAFVLLDAAGSEVLRGSASNTKATITLGPIAPGAYVLTTAHHGALRFAH